MTSPPLRLAIVVVRAWTHFYTWRMQPALRDLRRAEIESDLWEFRQDPAAGRGLSPAVHVLIRMLIGVPADLCWRAEHASVGNRLLRGTVALIAAVFLLAALWVLDLMRARMLPLPPPIAPLRNVSFITAPPPPPPPGGTEPQNGR